MKDKLKLINEIKIRVAHAKELGKRPAFSYDRVSDHANAGGMSLEYQGFNAQRYAEQTDLYIVHAFTIVESARYEGRKVFNLMLDLAVQLDVKDVIFKNIDRMSRNYADLLRIEKLYTDNAVVFHFYQSFRKLCQGTGYSEVFAFNVEMAAAKHTSDKISHDVYESHSYKAKKGVFPMGSPLGYYYDQPEKMHKIDPATENFMRFFFDEFDTGRYSLQAFADMLNDKGYKTKTGRSWSKTTVHYTLTSVFYHGQFYFRGSSWPGLHEPYYDIHRYEERIKRLGGDPSLPRTQKHFHSGNRGEGHDFRLKKILRCGVCGKTLTGDLKKGRYVYYTHTCENGRTWIKEGQLVAMIDEAVNSIEFTDGFAELLKGLFLESVEIKKSGQSPTLAAISRKIASLEAKQDKLVQLYAEDTVPHHILDRNIKDYQRQIKRLTEERGALQVDKNDFIINVASIIDNIRKLPAVYRESAENDRISLLRTMVDYIEVTDSVTIHWNRPYSFVLDPEIMGVRTRSGMLPRLDSNQRPTG